MVEMGLTKVVGDGIWWVDRLEVVKKDVSGETGRSLHPLNFTSYSSVASFPAYLLEITARYILCDQLGLWRSWTTMQTDRRILEPPSQGYCKSMSVNAAML
jgi:hypothetical protein